MIRAEQVRVSFGAAVALDSVSIEVPAGEWAALIGPNGAGKTTLLRAIAQMIRAKGRISVAGRPIGALTQRTLARLIAFVPQRPVLPLEMTGLDYVLLGRTPHIGYFAVESAADLQICADLLDRLELTRLATRPLATMSSGEAQRVVLARALAQEAPILLLDEPTSALDVSHRVDALELVDQMRKERSLTVLSAIHDLTLAGQFADRLVLLTAGRVAASGEPAEVLTAELLGQAFDTSVQVLKTTDGELAVISPRRRKGTAPH